MQNANSFIADELAHKTQYLHIALEQANKIIKTLETENIRLQLILNQLHDQEDSNKTLFAA